MFESETISSMIRGIPLHIDNSTGFPLLFHVNGFIYYETSFAIVNLAKNCNSFLFIYRSQTNVPYACTSIVYGRKRRAIECIPKTARTRIV